MTLANPSASPDGGKGDDVLDPSGFRNPAGPLGNASLLAALGWLVTDKRHNVSRPKLLLCVTAVDVACVFLAAALAYWLVSDPGQDRASMLYRSIAMACGLVFLLRRLWTYSISALRDLVGQMGKISAAVTLSCVLLAGIDHLFLHDSLSAATTLAWAVLLLGLLWLTRWLAHRGVRTLESAGRLTRRTVIVGGGREADELVAALGRDGGGGLELLGLFDDRADGREETTSAGLPMLGNFEALSKFCRDAGVDLLIVTVPQSAEYRLLQILQRLFTLPVDIRISAVNARVRFNRRAYTFIGKVPMLAVMDKPLSDWDRAIKNIEDRVLGTLLLILASPVMLAVAIAVRLDSPGPILFRQRRFGFNNELIDVYKFRSMRTDMLDANAAKLVTRDDPRVTRVGRFIRRTSLDELPQLINVLLGQMSLVGPRPHATQAKAESDLYHHVVQGYFARHRVKPGVTGWAQVNGWRGETDTHEKLERRVEHDIEYIDNWSVLFDLWILVLTPISMLRGENAY
jgi:Undecaprenyl-phosphate glucose phosphotransferase